jgi:hypothetical protein
MAMLRLGINLFSDWLEEELNPKIERKEVSGERRVDVKWGIS